MMDPEFLQERFLQVYNLHADAIFRHCYFRLHDRELARDCMQEIFMRTWQYYVRNYETIGNIRALLYRLANNLVIDEFRKKKTLSLENELEKGYQPAAEESRIHERIDGKAMMQLLKKLEPAYQEVIVMRYIDDLAPKEIAEILHQDPNAVSVRLTRALQKLRNFLPHE